MSAVSGSNRVNRGGSWNNNARNCRAPNRNHDGPGNRNGNLGFRLLSTRRRQGARFKDRARVPAPCPGGSSRSGDTPDEHPQPAASGRPAGSTAAAGTWPTEAGQPFPLRRGAAGGPFPGPPRILRNMSDNCCVEALLCSCRPRVAYRRGRLQGWSARRRLSAATCRVSLARPMSVASRQARAWRNRWNRHCRSRIGTRP